MNAHTAPIPSRAELSVREAARLIFAGREPSDRQLGAVLNCLKSGQLGGSRKGKEWVTSPGAVARYLARRAQTFEGETAGDDAATEAMAALAAVQHRQGCEARARKAGRPSTPSLGECAREFFAAVSMQSRASSGRVQRAVTVLQMGLVLLVLAALLGAAISLFAPAPPERQIVEAWIAEHHPGQIEIERWHAPQPNPQGEGTVVLVEYAYRASGGTKRPISTRQWFFIAAGQVTRVDSEL